MAKTKLQPGTFVYREMIHSKAYLSLKGFAPQLLLLFLLERGRETVKDKKGVKFKAWIDDNLTMPYATLEKTHSITRPRIVRAIDELLAKGFLEVRHTGGTYKKDKSIYALSDKYLMWRDGIVFSRRKYDIVRGYQGKKKNSERKHTHTHERKRTHTTCLSVT